LRFATTGGNGAALVIDTQKDAAYYKKQGGPVTPLLGNGNVVAAHAGMRFHGARPLANLGAGFVTIAPYDVLTYQPLNAFADLTTGELSVARVSSYQLTMDINLSFDEMNSGRTLQLQLYNATTNNPVAQTDLFVGRDTGGLVEFIIIGITATIAALTSKYVLQVGGGDAFTNVVLQGARFEVAGVGT
jgi:hypothetical protein